MPPQSCPTTAAARSTPSAERRASTSAASRATLYAATPRGRPERPHPRMSTAIARNPAAASAGSWWRQDHQNSGNPWSRTTSGPRPASTTCRVTSAVPTKWSSAPAIRGVARMPLPSCPPAVPRNRRRGRRHRRAASRRVASVLVDGSSSGGHPWGNMPTFPGTVPSRLPDVGTTIFTVMSRLAAEHGALNLSQGFPEFSAPPLLYDLVSKHMRAGENQYAPMAGVAALREAIAAKVEALYGRRYDPEHEITVTAGGTQAIFTAVAALVRPGDEVILFEPAYDSYAPSIALNGGTAVRAQLRFPDYRPDWAAVRRLVTPRTRLIVVNTPHNPSGTTWTEADLQSLARLVEGTDIVVLADEVYEHIVFDGLRHESCARHPALAERSFVISSFGKTYHVTGWKVGYVLAPRELMAEFRKAHQFIVFTVNTPVQLALAEYLRDASLYLELGAFY